MDKYDTPKAIGEARLNQEKFDWVQNSHLWYTCDTFGTQRCEWCQIEIRSGQMINVKFPGLCKDNPFVQELITNAQDQIAMETSEE